MKTTFVVIIDTDLEVDVYWWRVVLTQFMERILKKEAEELVKTEKKQKKVSKTRTEFSVLIDSAKGD